MAYNKEYYEANKDKFKAIRDKYRKNPENRDRINAQQREKYKNMSKEKKEALLQKNKEYRAENVTKSRLQYRINQRKASLKKLYAKYDEYINLSVIAAKEQNADETLEIMNKMHELKEKIDKKNEEIAKLEKEKELL